MVAGADVNATADFGWTPLHLAASFNASKVMRLLIGAGADVTAKTEGGETPLDIAQNQGSPDVVQILEANDGDDDGGAPTKTSKRGFLGIQIFAGCLLALFASLMCTISFRGRFAWPSDEWSATESFNVVYELSTMSKLRYMLLTSESHTGRFFGCPTFGGTQQIQRIILPIFCDCSLPDAIGARRGEETLPHTELGETSSRTMGMDLYVVH